MKLMFSREKIILKNPTKTLCPLYITYSKVYLTPVADTAFHTAVHINYRRLVNVSFQYSQLTGIHLQKFHYQN